MNLKNIRFKGTLGLSTASKQDFPYRDAGVYIVRLLGSAQNIQKLYLQYHTYGIANVFGIPEMLPNICSA